MNGSSTNISTKCLHTVVSKYFSSSPVMDESLSEFKEKKKGYTGPKNSAKPTGSKGRVKKPPKRIRGQKDIRSAINSKKNELVTYTKEFDEVCKLSGIDVDPEQLQLAIALSKSEELSAQECSSNQDAVLSAKERTGRIRTTLQEYGFTVPEVKVAGKKRQKKCHKKNYRLLQASEAEKQQIISDRYSQVLFENVYNYNKNACEHSITDQKLYFLSTSISYMDLRSNDVLYVDNLIEKSSSKGHLLRDWSDIPGRPQSPRREIITMDFSEIECSQEETDIILSGTLKSAKSVVHNKFKNMTNIPIIINIDDDINDQNKSVEKSENNGVQTLVVDEENCKNNSLHSSFNTLDRIRSKSPDIFDDSEISEDTIIKNFEDKNSIVIADSIDSDHRLRNMTVKCLNNEYIEKHTINDQNVSIMDLTEDNDKTSDNLTACSPKVTSQFSKTINFTRRNSNDVMEITECVAVSTALNSFSIENRNKTKRISNDYMEMTDCVDIAQCSSVDIEDKIDLTQNVDENNDVTQVDAIVSAAKEKIVDLSQSSGSEDELPMVQISGSNKPSLDDTILLDRDEIIINDNIRKSIDKEVVLQNKSSHDNSETLDLTQTPPKSNENESVVNESTSQSFFEEFIYNHSDEKIKETLDISNQSESINSKANDIEKIDLTQTNLGAGNIPGDIEVDLTQSSNSSNASMAYRSQNCSTPEKDLGKRDEVSIDYDDLFDDVAQGAIVNSETNNLSHQSRLSDLPDKEATNLESGKSSQVFDHSDKELEYSVNQSKVDLPLGVDFGGISVLDNMSGIGNRNSNINRTMNDSSLQAVSIPNVKQNIIRDSDEKKNLNKDREIHKLNTGSTKEVYATPFKTVEHNAFTADTPKCSDYIIKTDQVTPMLDYASMSTPERNRELDKYGLKPFKRKRAIQLLTHLYNQTHPLFEPCQEDLPSPSKKMKPCIEASSMEYPNLPDKCMKSPAKPIKSPAKCKKPPAKTIKSPAKSQKSPTKCIKSPAKSQKSPTKCKKSPAKSMKSPKCSQNEIFSELYEDSNIFQVTNEVPDIRDIVCPEEDWIFQKREKAKLHTCRLPLHIALHNYVSCRRLLREALLRYEPVNIDVIHKELVASGYRYDPKELLKFMDKKCITVKTADNNGRNNNR